MPKSKAYANPLPSLADEQRYATKCHELRAKIREIERDNQNVQLKIVKSKKNIQRLRIERSVLYDALATITTTAAQTSGLVVSPIHAPLAPSASTHLPAHPNVSHQQSPQPLAVVPNSQPLPVTSQDAFSATSVHPMQTSTSATEASNPLSIAPGRSYAKSAEPVSASPTNGISGLLNSNGVAVNGHPVGSSALPHTQYPPHVNPANQYHQPQPSDYSSAEALPATSVMRTIPLTAHHTLHHHIQPVTVHYQQPHHPQAEYPISNATAPTSASAHHLAHPPFQAPQPYHPSASPRPRSAEANGNGHLPNAQDHVGLEDADGEGDGEGTEEEEEEEEAEGEEDKGVADEVPMEEDGEEDGEEDEDDEEQDEHESQHFRQAVPMDTSDVGH
ncbi:hypothetical protein CROQUDRAFT_652802 [Cronartium quercuum f. sp. fusiforme G11]|uniref:INO80 complex subunit F domain-containing protein n=1 Tax=Cronartium quercuum f. sp. fusiforme G11 TaxID=708437 RepID=A0A9P6TEZ9_9BASI|nr:hypothetical protein CROQUDRAFT_652802 [Cronartium quercuum f. sp. fusiforme G11]